MIVPNQRGGLELVDQTIRPGKTPAITHSGVLLVPPTIEPDTADGPVLGQQLAQLFVLIVDVPIPIADARPFSAMSRRAAREIIGVMPIELRIVEEQLDALVAAGHRKLRQGIALERR